MLRSCDRWGLPGRASGRASLNCPAQFCQDCGALSQKWDLTVHKGGWEVLGLPRKIQQPSSSACGVRPRRKCPGVSQAKQRETRTACAKALWRKVQVYEWQRGDSAGTQAERSKSCGVGRVHRADPRPARGVLTSTQEQHQGLEQR